MSAVVAMPPVKPGDQQHPERFAGGPGRRRVPLHPDRQLRGPAAAARRVAAGEHLPGQQAAGRPGRGGRAVDAGAHVRPAHGPGGGRAAADASAPATRSGSCATPRTSPRASSRPASTTPASCRAPATSPATSASTSWPGPATSCGWSTPASPACVRCTPTTASCRAGGRRSSPPWPPRTAAI